MTDKRDELIAEIEKNSLEQVRVHLCAWRDNQYIDVRIWYRKAESDGDAFHPGPKGIRIHCELLPDLIDALQKAQKAIEG